MNNHTARTAVGGAALAAVLLLTACGSEAGAPASSTSPTPSASLSAAPNESQDPDLLQLNESLKEALGDKYAEAWIADNKLHVAVTDKASESIVAAAGAVAHLAEHSAAELEAAIGKIMAWQRDQGGDTATAIYRYLPSGRDGSITLAVDPAQLEDIRQGLAADKVTGDIALKFVESAGPATPASSG
ncbi:hypothetical protein ACIPVK_00530 [Paeniglutamicibacter sp. MACA_103]|uniref:hypothetical protein n=1 Tax=Paeniglutamicibacter sp. MACA_103 TaxID=3377337 RepID=UPI0038943D91